VIAEPIGLTSADALLRFEQIGANAVADVADHPVRLALGKLWAPVPWLLEAAIGLQLGLREYVEAGVVAALLISTRRSVSFKKREHKTRWTRSNRAWRSLRS
jgi:hypothetical protein